MYHLSSRFEQMLNLDQFQASYTNVCEGDNNIMSHPVDIHVGRKLKEVRIMRRLSQTDVGKKLNLSFQQIQKYEIGANRIAASRLFELSEALGVPASYFFEGITPANDQPDLPNPNIDIVRAISNIQDDGIKTRIVTLIEDISGITVARKRA